ncbi:putative 2'-deoxynucleoside 5'-phosphate N-hydrolase 1 [Haliotis cracherodii]|uniref:putative 2'-deoxynucleoside 5'-phosphate N-hydrolase 1 n=1 Tax=Haliotis cracherodii TaxID=6455 RepID=UPI0039E83C89
MRKLYFGGSISAGRQDCNLYARIIAQLEAYGSVLTKYVGDQDAIEKEKDLAPKANHDRDIAWLKECDALIVEVTQASLGVGYEIGRAVAMDKRVLILFRPETGKKCSKMVAGAADGTTVVFKEYCEDQLPAILAEFFSVTEKQTS